MSLKSTYARFKTAFFSGKRSAYFGMLVLAISPLTIFFDRLFSRKETPVNKVGKCILIVCPPRTGGTIIYQVISHLIPSIYMSNAHQLFPYAGSSLLRFVRRRTSKKISFDNFFGYAYGLSGVNEGNDAIGALYASGHENIRNEFIGFYSRMTKGEDLPLILKNVRHYEKFIDLCKAVPELKIIRVKRNLEQAAQSEFLAFKKLKYFHPIPNSISHLYQKVSPHEFAVRQMLEMNKDIDQSLLELDSSRYIEIDYEDFCKRPEHYAELINKDFCGNDKSSLRIEKLPLKASFSRKIDKLDADKISQYIKELSHE